MAEYETLGAVVGENVRRLRLAQDLTQHELAQRFKWAGLNWARSKIAMLENGHRPTISMGEALVMALALRVQPGDLFAGEGPMRLDPTEVLTSREAFRSMAWQGEQVPTP